MLKKKCFAIIRHKGAYCYAIVTIGNSSMNNAWFDGTFDTDLTFLLSNNTKVAYLWVTYNLKT